MLKSFTDEFNIDKDLFFLTYALDIILNVDTNYFIDPVLLRTCNIPEFVGAPNVVKQFFENIITLLKHSKNQQDMFWKKANKLLTFKEIKGTCLGYSNHGTDGNAIGPELRNKILKTIVELLKAGEVDPIIFELLGVFQEKVGCDRVSDLLTYILKDKIEAYTMRINKELGISDLQEGFLINPYNKEKILLLPKSILTPLPIAESFDDIDFACSENKRVRDEINKFFDLGNRKKLLKSEINYLLKHQINYRKTIIKKYKDLVISEYDFDNDPAGEIIWYPVSKTTVKNYPIKLSQPESFQDMIYLIEIICLKFKELVEENGLWRLLYDDKIYPKRESAAQLLFYGIADAYCNANNIDLSREVNNGHGPVDFKLSKGADKKVVIEIKLTSNQQLMHGFEVQLPKYMKQENTNRAIYLIIENGHRRRFDKFQSYYNKLSKEHKEKIKYIMIDANIQKSASKE